jgi:hypothetical protein
VWKSRRKSYLISDCTTTVFWQNPTSDDPLQSSRMNRVRNLVFSGLVAISAIFAFGCQHLAPPADAPSASSKSYVIPFEMGETHVPIISGIINPIPDYPQMQPPIKRLAVDSAAAHTSYFVSDEAVTDLAKLIPQATIDKRRSANGKIVRVCHIEKGRVTVGNISVDMPVDATADDMRVDPGFDGVVGTDFLSHFFVQIDYQAKTVTLTER